MPKKLDFAEYMYDRVGGGGDFHIIAGALRKARLICNIGRGKKRSSKRLANERTKIDKEGFVYLCRIHCGAEIVILSHSEYDMIFYI
ncbi:hypothetical protein ACHAXA_003826 [Cyclostephanos tholiformis]|uniref:Uncharacterized protein n=1 Tax=Cyclostephanos tholiformis TaxID=382380 RepID=A0ABD3RWH9_9STRA